MADSYIFILETKWCGATLWKILRVNRRHGCPLHISTVHAVGTLDFQYHVIYVKVLAVPLVFLQEHDKQPPFVVDGPLKWRLRQQVVYLQEEIHKTLLRQASITSLLYGEVGMGRIVDEILREADFKITFPLHTEVEDLRSLCRLHERTTFYEA